MRWEDERYVRVYTRDTGDWLALSFTAQALFLLLLRKVDRIGELRLGKRGRVAIGACVGHPDGDFGSAVSELLNDGCVRLNDDETVLFVPNFLKAQDTPKTPTERKREQRERDAAKTLENTGRVTKSRDGHAEVTKSHSVPNRAVPSVPSVPSLKAVDAENSEPAPIAIVPLPPRPDDPYASGPAYFAFCQHERLAVGYATEKPPPLTKLSAWFNEVMLEFNGDGERLDATLAVFVKDEYWKVRNLPFRAFMKHWRQYAPRKAVAL